MRCFRCKQKFEQSNKITRCPFCGYNLVLHREKLSRLRILVVLFLFLIYVIIFILWTVHFDSLECDGEKCLLKRYTCSNINNAEILDEFYQKDIKRTFIKMDNYIKKRRGFEHQYFNYTLYLELSNSRIINTGLEKSNSSKDLKNFASDIMAGKSARLGVLRQ